MNRKFDILRVHIQHFVSKIAVLIVKLFPTNLSDFRSSHAFRIFLSDFGAHMHSNRIGIWVDLSEFQLIILRNQTH